MSASTETLRATLSRLVRRELAKLGIVTFHEYRVVLQSHQYVELQAVRALAGLPDVARCVARPGAAGYSIKYKLGSTVLVGFVEGDPAQPFIAFGHAAEDPEGPLAEGSSLPTTVRIDATGSGSTVDVGRSADDVFLGAAQSTVIRDGDHVSITGLNPVDGKITLANAPPLDPPKSKVKA